MNNILTKVPDNSLDYIFSYDMFKFIPYDDAKSIITSLYNKCKCGSSLLISYADIYKLWAVRNKEDLELYLVAVKLFDIQFKAAMEHLKRKGTYSAVMHPHCTQFFKE